MEITQNIEITRIADTFMGNTVYAVTVDGVQIGTVERIQATWTSKPAGRRYSTRTGQRTAWEFNYNGGRVYSRKFDTRKEAVAALVKVAAG
jgi:hypothetical protein